MNGTAEQGGISFIDFLLLFFLFNRNLKLTFYFLRKYFGLNKHTFSKRL